MVRRIFQRQGATSLIFGLFLGLSVSHAQVLDLAPSQVSLSVSASSSSEGQPVNLTAVVEPLEPSDGFPAGMVEFLDGSESLGSAVLEEGESGLSATLAVDDLPPGPHMLGVRYLGDASFAPSMSLPVLHDVLAE